MGFILSFIAYTLFIVLAPLNFVAVLASKAQKRSYLKATNAFWKLNAYELDVFGNTHYATLFNATLRKSKGYKFGKQHETISSALGKLQQQKKLSLMGWLVVYILWAIDYKYWKKGGHCINSIQNYIK